MRFIPPFVSVISIPNFYKGGVALRVANPQIHIYQTDYTTNCRILQRNVLADRLYTQTHRREVFNFGR